MLDPRAKVARLLRMIRENPFGDLVASSWLAACI
jgi:hypothetical protein